MSDDREQFFTRQLAKLGIAYSVEFVPFSKSRNAKPKPGIRELQINWRVSFMRGGYAFTCDYQQGIGHLPQKLRARFGSGYTTEQNELIRIAVERGSVNGRPLDPPKAGDVLESLISDASVLDHGSFEEWAQEFGYETDSRMAEKTYRTCLEQALKFRSTIGDAAFTELRDGPKDDDLPEEVAG